jgi:hypothetical protein
MHGQWARSSVSSATPNASYDPWEPTAPAAHAEHDSDPTGAPAVGPPPVDGRFAASTWAGAVATQLAALDLVIWELEAGWTDSVVLTWWSAPRELSFVELAEDGPVLPVETLPAEHGPEHPHRLVHEAIRIVEDRH